jgi:hypothetical protein
LRWPARAILAGIKRKQGEQSQFIRTDFRVVDPVSANNTPFARNMVHSDLFQFMMSISIQASQSNGNPDRHQPRTHAGADSRYLAAVYNFTLDTWLVLGVARGAALLLVGILWRGSGDDLI